MNSESAPWLSSGWPKPMIWIALDSSEGGAVRVIDSLRDEPSIESAEEFLRRDVLSLLLVRPAGPSAEPFVPHKAGLLEMNRVRARMK